MTSPVTTHLKILYIGGETNLFSELPESCELILSTDRDFLFSMVGDLVFQLFVADETHFELGLEIADLITNIVASPGSPAKKIFLVQNDSGAEPPEFFHAIWEKAALVRHLQSEILNPRELIAFDSVEQLAKGQQPVFESFLELLENSLLEIEESFARAVPMQDIQTLQRVNHKAVTTIHLFGMHYLEYLMRHIRSLVMLSPERGEAEHLQPAVLHLRHTIQASRRIVQEKRLNGH